VHRNARLTPAGRLLLCQRIQAGWPVAHAAESMGISRDRACVWWRRYQAEGVAGLEDRSSRPHRSSTRTKASCERRIISLRRRPATNGKVERFNRTLLAEWAYARPGTQAVNAPAR
jgi:hypothetical protein